MRDIDMLDLRWHKGEPTWDIIDQLIEHIDSLAGVTHEEFEEALDAAYTDGYEDGKWVTGD